MTNLVTPTTYSGTLTKIPSYMTAVASSALTSFSTTITQISNIKFLPVLSGQPVITTSPSNFDSICTTAANINRFTVNAVTQAVSNFYFTAGTAATFSITPFSATASCGSPMPTVSFAYQGYKSDTSPLPSYITVDATTGAISVSSAAPIGNTTIVVFGYLSNQQ